MRIGTGYDAHQLIEGRDLILGGVTIPFEKGLDGHSDADVLLHAIIDALLGAAALGNIGMLFPDTNQNFKNISSIILLEKTAKHLEQAGYKIVNIDSTIVAQRPKMLPYIELMRENIARCCEIEMCTVSVKAKTEENMGFTGSGQGMSAHAVCLID